MDDLLCWAFDGVGTCRVIELDYAEDVVFLEVVQTALNHLTTEFIRYGNSLFHPSAKQFSKTSKEILLHSPFVENV